MKKILVPCDFSNQAIEAFKFALALSKKTKAKVVVLNVVEIPVYLEASVDVQIPTFDPVLLQDLTHNAHKNFKKVMERFGKKANVSFSVVHGLVTPSINEYIQEKRISLVVMGTQGATGLKEFFVGSNTEKIVRSSPVPVFAIRKAPKIASLKNIVFPVDTNVKQAGLVSRVKEFQRMFKSTLHILIVNTPEFFRRDEDIKLSSESFIRKSKLTNYTLNIRSDVSESSGIVAFANEISADMIIMGTHGRKGLAHLFSGSIAEDVVNRVTCPIWTCLIK